MLKKIIKMFGIKIRFEKINRRAELIKNILKNIRNIRSIESRKIKRKIIP